MIPSTLIGRLTSRRKWLRPIRLALGCMLSVSCFNSPLWRFDSFLVAGSVRGSECTITVDGVPVPRDTVLSADKVLISIDDTYNIGLPAELGLKTISCNGLLLSIAAPLTALPPTGAFRVSKGTWRLNRFSAALFSPTVGTGIWPLALTGVYLEGYDGTVKLDSVTKTEAWAEFRFRARRIARGE
jgi:hypothetical protein